MNHSSLIESYVSDTDRSVESWLYTHFPEAISRSISKEALQEHDLTGFFDAKDHYYAELLDLLLPHLTEDSLFLDMGCAVGRLALELGNHVKHAYGIDPSPACIDAAKTIAKTGSFAIPLGEISVPEFASSHSEFIVGDDASHPFAPETFDVVCCSSVIDRVPNAEVFLKRVYPLVRSGGFLVITDPFDWNPEYSKEEFWLGHGAFGTNKGKAEVALSELLMRNGFERVEERNIPWRTYSHRRNHKVWMVYASVYRKSSHS